MASEVHDLVVRVVDASDVEPIVSLRSLSSPVAEDDPDLARRIAAWLFADGDRRTTWLATLRMVPVGMASVFEYRRMPRPGHADSRWGYVGNMFVREDVRDRGIGSTLLGAIIAAADERRYARLVLSPSARALPLFRRAGFSVADDTAGDHRLLVRPARPA